jgi:hypothetical protein
MTFWRLRDNDGDPLYLDPERIVAVYLSNPDAESGDEGGKVLVLLKDSGTYFTLDESSGLQVLEHFQLTSVVPGEKP